MKTLKLIIIYSLILCSISGQKNCKIKIDSTHHFVPIEGLPFEIERDSVYAKIPDSLGISLSGFAAIELHIKSNSIIENFDILRLMIKKKDKIIIDYFILKNEKKIIYPLEVLKYYQFLSEYTKTLKVKKIFKNKQKSTIIYLLVRFR